MLARSAAFWIMCKRSIHMCASMHDGIDPVSENPMLSEFNSAEHFNIVLSWVGGYAVPPVGGSVRSFATHCRGQW